MTTEASLEGLSGTHSTEPPRARPASRLLVSLAAASAASVGVAAVDALFASRTNAGQGASWAALWLADIGILSPISLVIGFGCACAAIFVAPAGLPSLGEIWAGLDRGSRSERAGRSARMISIAVFGVFALALTAQSAKYVLGGFAPVPISGAVLAVSDLAIWIAVGVLAAESERGARSAAPEFLTAPKKALVGAAFAGTALFAFGILSGNTNGDGGLLDIFGVLKREELDLRGLALASVPAACALVAQSAGLRLPRVASIAALVAPLAVTPLAAGPLLDRAAVAIALERGAPFGAPALSLLRHLTDRDHDGASALFGGGDCNDHDPRIFPAAFDVPGNGIDEDCSGSDEPVRAPAVAPAAIARSSWVADHFPRGLNVVLITVDTLRGDLGYAGNPRPLSPRIDELARRSVVFDRAYSLASYTGKSVGPMLIGKYPSETRRTFDHFDRFLPEETFVQERLRRANVRTLTAQAHWYFGLESGIGRGFDETDRSAAPKIPQAEGDRTVSGDKLADAAIRLLSEPENAARRFYLWVHFVDPHAAYVPHPEFDFGSTSRDLYDGEVAFVDHQIGRLLDALRQSPFADRTAVVLSSDHGEAFGEHGLLRHGFELWEELVRVPLVVSIPGVPPHHVEVPRSAIDLVPTLLDLYDAPKPSGVGADFVSGRSLLPDLASDSGEPRPEERPVLVDMAEGPNNGERQALVDGHWKVIATNGRPLGLYDLASDPGEKKDLLAAKPDDPMIQRFQALRHTIRSIPAVR